MIASTKKQVEILVVHAGAAHNRWEDVETAPGLLDRLYDQNQD